MLCPTVRPKNINLYRSCVCEYIFYHYTRTRAYDSKKRSDKSDKSDTVAITGFQGSEKSDKSRTSRTNKEESMKKTLIYEKEKERIIEKSMDSASYEKEIRKLAKKLKI